MGFYITLLNIWIRVHNWVKWQLQKTRTCSRKTCPFPIFSDSHRALRHLKVINFPRTCCAFPDFPRGIFLSKDHKSTHIIPSNHDGDDPSHLVSQLWRIKPVGEEIWFVDRQLHRTLTLRLSMTFSWQQNNSKYSTLSFLPPALAAHPPTPAFLPSCNKICS